MNPPTISPRVISKMLVFGLVGGASSIAAPEMKTTPVDRTVLRIARSKDGLSFKEDEGVFLQGASNPTIAKLKNGSLIVMADFGSGGRDGGTLLSVTRSDDGGAKWSPLRPAKIQAPDAVRLTANHASFARSPNGQLHVFFASTPSQTRKSSPIMIFSAVTRNGLDLAVDRSMRLGLPNSSEAHPMGIATNDRLHLLIERIAKGRKQRTDEPVLEHFVSMDGSDFARLAPTRFEDLRFVGDVTAFAEEYRAYVSTSAGIASLVSKDLRKWKPEKGVRIMRGWDPAVTKLSDGTFLMIYCTKMINDGASERPIVDTAFFGDDSDPTDWILEADVQEEDMIADASHDPADAIPAPDPDTSPDTDNDPQGGDTEVIVPVGMPNGASADTEERDWVIDPEHKDDWWEYWDPEATDGFAPTPDFATKVDYFSWYKDYLLPVPDNNAFDAYAEFMPGLYPNGPPEWPRFQDLFTEDNVPGPWKDEDHPDWAASNDEIQNLLDQFHEAVKIPGYAVPPHTDLDYKEEQNDEDRLLMGILLPNLSSHRTITKSMIADAWRTGADGKVSPDRMRRAIETTLRGAEHMEQGQTLIEELVGLAERNLVRDTARRALQHDVFSAGELEGMLDTLQALDQPMEHLAKGSRMEHGFSMDITQHLFSPPTEDGQPKFNPERARKVAPFSEKDEKWVEEMSKMTPDDVRASLDAFNRHYQEFSDQLRIGYPDIRVADLEALEEENVHTSPLTEAMMPAFSRYYQLRSRGEAARRATQLTYAVHLYKKRNGRWPASVDELPINHSAGARTDPFTGEDFKYEMTDSGPRIYSLSENATDDGGKHSRRWDDRAQENGGSDDYVFWPPQPNR